MKIIMKTIFMAFVSLTTTVQPLRDLISDLSLGHWAALWSSEARESSRILAAQRVETLATAMQRKPS